MQDNNSSWREIPYFKNIYTTTGGMYNGKLHYFCLQHREVEPVWIRVGEVHRAACPRCLLKSAELIQPAKTDKALPSGSCKACGAGPMLLKDLHTHNAIHEKGGVIIDAVPLCHKCGKSPATVFCSECEMQFCEDCTVGNTQTGKGVCGDCMDAWRFF